MTLSFGGGAGVLTIPGLTSDGANGVVVAETLTAGDLHANGNTAPNFHGLTGATELDDAVGNNPDADTVLLVKQHQGFSVNEVVPTVWLQRDSALNGHTCTPPVLLIIDRTGTADIVTFDGGVAGGKIHFGNGGGIGLFDHAPPTAAASITGALSTVTDAAAKAVLTAIIAALIADGGATNDTT